VADVLVVAAFELGNPMTLLVLMKTHDASMHARADPLQAAHTV